MTDKELAELRGVERMQSRILVLDALCTFHPGVRTDGTDPDPVLSQEIRRWHESRWYPAEGGFRVLVPNDGQPCDPEKFIIGEGAWDHNTCDYCSVHIPAMTLC
jgi:hypothetical protein